MFCKLVLPCKDIHKLSSLPDTYDDLHLTITEKLKDKIPDHFYLKYKDSDEELINLTNDEDFQTAILTAKDENIKTLRLFIYPKFPSGAASRVDLGNPLPGIPEALERSKSTITDCSLHNSNIIKSPEKQNAFLFSPKNDFLQMLPRSNSINFTDLDSVNSVNQTPKAFDNVLHPRTARRAFTFTEESAFPPTQGLNNSRGLLTEAQEELEQKFRLITTDLITRIQEELALPAPSPRRQTFFGSTMTPQSVCNSKGRRFTFQCPREFPEEGVNCSICSEEMQCIKYMCLSCQNFVCCSSCESQGSHPHPLLKVRLNDQTKGNEAECSGETVSSSNMEGSGVMRNRLRHSTVAAVASSIRPVGVENVVPNFEASLMSQSGINKSGGKKRSPAQSLRRGMSLETAANSEPGLRSSKMRGAEDCRYKAEIVKSSFEDSINVKPSEHYSISLIIKNPGDCQWPEKVSLVCKNGIHIGNTFDVVSLDAQEEERISLSLLAPIHHGKYISQWKLQYDEDGVVRQFGKAIYVSIEVVNCRDRLSRGKTPESADSKEGTEEVDSSKSGMMFENKTQEIERILMKETDCTEKVFAMAKMLNDMFPGEVKEKITFIKKFEASLNINEIVGAYLARISHSSRKRATWADSQSSRDSVQRLSPPTM